MKNRQKCVDRLTTAIEEATAARIRGALDGAVGAVSNKPRRGRPPGSARTKPTHSPARAKALQRQGRYIATLRRLTGAKRARVKAMAQSDGVAAALKLADKLG